MILLVLKLKFSFKRGLLKKFKTVIQENSANLKIKKIVMYLNYLNISEEGSLKLLVDGLIFNGKILGNTCGYGRIFN